MQSVKRMLEEIDIPIKYHSFKEPPSLPYAVFLVTDRIDLNAEGRNYFKSYVIDLEIYTDNHEYDFDLQEKVERVLEKHHIYYQNMSVEIPEHRMFQMIYTFQIREGEL